MKVAFSAVNEHPNYLACVSFFMRSWECFGYNPLLLYVGASLPESLQHFRSNVIVFDPPEGFPTAFLAQTLRLLWPCLLQETEKVMITDVDMVPLNRKFFVDTVDSLPADRFNSIDYKFQLFKYRTLPMCYVVATPELWRECIGVDTLSSLHTRLLDWKHEALRYESKHNGVNWAFDQVMLTKYASRCSFANYTNYGGHRLERKDIDAQPVSSLKDKIAQGFYRDYHIFANEPSSLAQAHLSSLVLDILRTCVHR